MLYPTQDPRVFLGKKESVKEKVRDVEDRFKNSDSHPTEIPQGCNSQN